MTHHILRRAAQLALFLALTLAAGTAPCAESMTVDIFGPGQSKLHTAVARPTGPDANATLPAEAGELKDMVLANLRYLPFLQLIPGQEILGGDSLDGYTRLGIDFKRFQLAEADLLVTMGWPDPKPGQPNTIEIRAYEVFTTRLLVGKAYYDIGRDKLQLVADMFCSALMEALTGRGEFFRSTLAFVNRVTPEENKQIWTVHPTGRDLRRITRLKGICLSPDWSVDGRYIIFTNIGDRAHSLGLWDRKSGRVRTVTYPGYTLIGPSFTPENKVVVSMASVGSPDIYLLDHVFKVEKVLVENWAIDVSPSIDARGKTMAFVSSRLGTPHIFALDMETGETRQVTFNGKYNQHPSISPDGELVAFSRLTGEGHRIFVMDMKTGQEKQASFGPGNDEMPAFAPDGYFLAFSSNRSGKYRVYLTTRHGDQPMEVQTGPGESSFPAWGLTPQ